MNHGWHVLRVLKCALLIFSFNAFYLHSHFMVTMTSEVETILISTYMPENWRAARIRQLPRIVQLQSGRAKVWSQAIRLVTRTSTLPQHIRLSKVLKETVLLELHNDTCLPTCTTDRSLNYKADTEFIHIKWHFGKNTINSKVRFNSD